MSASEPSIKARRSTCSDMPTCSASGLSQHPERPVLDNMARRLSGHAGLVLEAVALE